MYPVICKQLTPTWWVLKVEHYANASGYTTIADFDHRPNKEEIAHAIRDYNARMRG